MKTGIAIVALLLCASVTAFAQGGSILGLDEAIALALKNNRDLQIARLAIDNADAQVSDALGNALPTLDFNTRYTRNVKKQVFFFPGDDGISRPISVGSDNAVSSELTLNQIVFNSAVFTGVGTSRIYAKISREQLRAKASEVVLNTKLAYYTAALAREVLNVNQTLLQNADENYRNTKALYEGGLRSEFDAIRSEVQASNQRPLVVQARDNYQQAIDNLKLVMGVPQGTEISLAPVLIRPELTAKPEPSSTEAASTIQQSNPQLQALRYSQDVNDELIAINSSEYLPTVSLFGAYKFEAQDDELSGLDFQPTAYVGLNLSLNLFNGFRTDAQVDQAQVAYEQSKYQYVEVDNALKVQLEAVLRKIGYARERISAGDQTIRQAERGYEISKVAYNAGTGTQLQINDADLALAQAKLNVLNAIYDYNVALAELELLMGDKFKLTSNQKDIIYSGE